MIDVAQASFNRFGPRPEVVYEDWAEFREWECSARLPTGEPFDPRVADAPSPAPRQLFAVGLNYREHQVESGFPEPSEPMVFAKFVSAITGPVGDVVLFTEEVDWEAEAAIVIGTIAYEVSQQDAWVACRGHHRRPGFLRS